VDDHCTVRKEKSGAVCLSDVEAFHKMQPELMEKRVDITLYLAFGFKQLSGDNIASPPHPGK
jgi:hypothetical protein